MPGVFMLNIKFSDCVKMFSRSGAGNIFNYMRRNFTSWKQTARLGNKIGYVIVGKAFALYNEQCGFFGGVLGNAEHRNGIVFLCGYVECAAVHQAAVIFNQHVALSAVYAFDKRQSASAGALFLADCSKVAQYPAQAWLGKIVQVGAGDKSALPGRKGQ